MGTIPPDVRLALESLKRNPHTVVLVEDPTAGPDLSYVDDSQADFEQGTMDGVRVDMRPGLVRLRCFGACLGPVNKGDRYLGARVWMVTKEGDKIIVRQANETNDAWALDEEAEGMSAEEQAAADLPDIYFDKQGQYVIAYEKTGAGGPEVWVSRVTTDPETGQRLVVQEKVADGREPKVIRDLDNDMVVFYRDVTDPQNTIVKYRIQSEGWLTERTVPIALVGEKWIEDVVVCTDYRLMLLFTLKTQDYYQPYVMFTKMNAKPEMWEDIIPVVELVALNLLFTPMTYVDTEESVLPGVLVTGLTLEQLWQWDGSITDIPLNPVVLLTGLTLVAVQRLIYDYTEQPLNPNVTVRNLTLLYTPMTNYSQGETLNPGIVITNVILTHV